MLHHHMCTLRARGKQHALVCEEGIEQDHQRVRRSAACVQLGTLRTTELCVPKRGEQHHE